MNVAKFLTGWSMVIIILVLASAGAFLNRDKILALASTIQARFTPPNLEAGLVRYWSFNGADLTDKVYDRSGQGNNGYFVGGATSTAKVPGKIGQALNFDGSNDYVGLPSTLTLSRGSISVWVKGNFNSSPAAHYYIFGGIAGGNSFTLEYNAFTDHDNFAMTYRGSFGNTVYVVSPDNGPSNAYIAGWHHIVGTWDVNLQGKIYIDGVLLGTDNTTTGTLSNLVNTIGQHNGGERWAGLIDELRIYSRVLSLEEVQHLYNQGGGSKVQASQNDQVANGLVGLWSFDGSDVTDKVYDRSGNGNNGFLVNMSTTTAKVPGKIGQALEFDGTDDRVSTSDIAAIDTATALSSCVWVKNDTNTTDDMIVQKYAAGDDGWSFQRDDVGAGSGRTDMYALYLADSVDSDTVRVEGATGTSITGIWNHVCFTFLAGSATGARLYVNGVEDVNSPVSTASVGAINGGTSPVEIGATGAGSSPHDGLLDDVRIYTRVLSADEIWHLYNIGVASKANASQNDEMTSGLVGLWSFDGADVTDKIYDRSGNGNNGFFVNMSTTSAKVAGKIAQALQFDGANDRLDTVVGSLSGPYTISAWVKPTNITTNGYIFSEHTSGDANTDKVMWLKGAVLSGAWGLTGKSYTIDGVYRQSASGVITAGEWQHLVATYDGGTAGSGIHLYRNGVESPSYTLSVDSSGSPETGGGTWSIGGRKYDNARNLNGSLDDVRVYDRELSQEEVIHLYNKGR